MRRSTFIAAADDGMWFTADDIPNYYVLYIYDVNGGITTEPFNDPGPDGLWFTEDDLYV